MHYQPSVFVFSYCSSNFSCTVPGFTLDGHMMKWTLSLIQSLALFEYHQQCTTKAYHSCSESCEFYSTGKVAGEGIMATRELHYKIAVRYFLFFLQCRLIISQMSGMPAELFNLLLIPLAVAVGSALLLPRYELMTLYIYSAIILVAHLHYAICIVEELCEHFRIYAFSLAKRDPDS